MRVASVDEPGQDWEGFATSHPRGLLGHAAAWGPIFQTAYGLRPAYLEARSGEGHLRGILPLVHFRSLRGQKELISLPFLDSAGVLADDPESGRLLREAALELARSAQSGTLELRQASPADGAPTLSDRVGMVLRLAGSEESQWKALRSETRNQTRKARREGLEIAEGDESELRAAFYAVFRENMRDLGSPVHSQRFFAAMSEHFRERLRFIVASLAGRPVGGLVAIHHGDSVSVPWASTLRSERKRCPNNLIYWEALRWAIARGACELDFGRSEPSGGTHRFKRGWGAEEQPLAWQRLAPDGSPLPLRRSGDSALFQHLSKAWTRLPVGVSARVGPAIRRFLSE